MLYLSLRLVHFIFMATWFGGSVFALRDIKTSLAGGASQIAGLRDRMARVGRLAFISGAMTILSGLALIFALGGFAAVPRAIHIGLLLGVLTAVIGGAGVGRTWAAIDAELAKGSTLESLGALVKRLTMFSGIFSLLWLVSLGLMVFRGMIG